jgi:hypothetical protein
MLARLDDLPQRHRWVTRRAAAPDVDFRTSMRWGRMRSRDDPCSRNSPFPACHAKPLTIGLSLAEIAGITNSWQQQQQRRPASAEPRDWHNACGNCGNPRHGPPAGHRDRNWGGAERAERSETHFSPISIRKYSCGATGRKYGTTVGQLVGSLAGQWELPDVVPMVPTYSGAPWRSLASYQKISNLFNAGKPQTPANGAYLFRPSASLSSERDAQVGMFESEGLARRQARQSHPAHQGDGESDGASRRVKLPCRRPPSRRHASRGSSG